MIAPINRRFHVAPPQPLRADYEPRLIVRRSPSDEWSAAFAAGVFVGLSVSAVVLFVVLGLQ